MADVAEFMGARRNPSLDMTSGQAAFARKYGSPPAWHQLGTEAPAGATMAEWLKAAHLDFEVVTTPIAYKVPFNGQNWHPADDHRGVVRVNKDSADFDKPSHGAIFQVASKRFKPLQPAEIVQWMWENAERYGMPLETLGSLGKGEQFWIQIMITAHKAERKKHGTWFGKVDWKHEAEEEIEKIKEN